MSKYSYTLLLQDETVKELGVFNKRKGFDWMRGVLGCSVIELIPKIYAKDRYDVESKDVQFYGDEEGRYNSDNVRNQHFRAIKEETLIWDVVGNIIREEVIHEDNN